MTGEERRVQYYALLACESARLSRMLENLLDFLRLKADRYQFRFQPVQIDEWLTAKPRCSGTKGYIWKPRLSTACLV